MGTSLAGSAVSSGVNFGSSFVSGVANSFAQANLGAVGMAALVPIVTGAGAIVASTVGTLSLIPGAVAGATVRNSRPGHLAWQTHSVRQCPATPRSSPCNSRP